MRIGGSPERTGADERKRGYPDPKGGEQVPNPRDEGKRFRYVFVAAVKTGNAVNYWWTKRLEGTMRGKNSYVPFIVAGLLVIIALGFNPLPAVGAGPSLNPFGKPTPDKLFPSNDLNATSTKPGVMRATRPAGWVDQTRSEILGRNGVVTTSEPQAAQAGLKILQDGGNAVDAAVATMAMIALQEPNSTGLGAEMFAQIWDAKTKKLYEISANGPSPKNYTPELFKLNVDSSGNPYLPRFSPPYGSPGTTGIFSAMIPGSVDGWDKMLKRFGTMKFKEVLEPARQSAVEGFPVHEVLAANFYSNRNTLCNPAVDPDTPDVYCKGGSVPGLYSIFKNPDMGHTFEVLQKKGVDAFYKGEIAQAIVNKANSLGVVLPPGVSQFWTMDDLKKYQARWEEPLTTNYHGYDIYETPPPSQGWAALEMLNILEQCAEFPGAGDTNPPAPYLSSPPIPFDLGAIGRENPLFTHIEVEAKKLAYSDLLRYNADPDFYNVLPDQIANYFNNKTWVKNNLCNKIYINPPQARAADVLGHLEGGTIYGASADRWGNMVSFVYSVYTSWGSKVTIPGYGFQLSSRGGMFTFDPDHPNTLAGGKRPFITIIAGFIMKDGEPLMAFGNMGGATQPHGHVQHIVNMIDLGFNVQATSDAARWDHSQSATSNRLQLDYYLYDLLAPQLEAWGHGGPPPAGTGSGSIQRSRGLGGGYQGILFERDYSLPEPVVPGGKGGKGVAHQEPLNGIYRAGSELRKDGAAVGW
jgi:gamma-glutamyltranspeptidase/glutathione hydrolase